MVLAIKGTEADIDWMATASIQKSCDLLKAKPLWFVEHTSRRCNFFAHNLAKWARLSNFRGSVNLESLPPCVFCDGEDLTLDLLDDDCNG